MYFIIFYFFFRNSLYLIHRLVFMLEVNMINSISIYAQLSVYYSTLFDISLYILHTNDIVAPMISASFLMWRFVKSRFSILIILSCSDNLVNCRHVFCSMLKYFLLVSAVDWHFKSVCFKLFSILQGEQALVMLV